MLRRFLDTASILCCVLCLAFMGMWIRSYRTTDYFWVPLPGGYGFGGSLFEGRPAFHFLTPEATGPGFQLSWRTEPVVEENVDEEYVEIEMESNFWEDIGFHYNDWPSADDLTVPYYSLVLASGALAFMLRMRWPWRFSLRQLLVATTFLAIVFGMIVTLDSSWIGK